ncbi:MAG: hypothetical protein GWM87_04530 [Xanthomonadales bacterium]|nr:hypothetical protein [Xanthomonadales bacterium]NIX12275.1 hypothetical protein [Xanthomonadales bacterium]
MAVPVAALVYFTLPSGRPAAEGAVSTANIRQVRDIGARRCQQCHMAMPKFSGLAGAPLGIGFDSREQVLEYAGRMYEMTAITRTMPPDNGTQITEDERQIIAQWIARLQYFLDKESPAVGQ